MSLEEKKFSDFGSAPKKGSYLSLSFLFKLLFFGGLILAIPVALSGWKDFYRSLAERVPPTISVVNSLKGIGPEGASLELEVKDALSGIDQVNVRVRQGSLQKTLMKKNYEKRVNDDFLVIPLNAKDLGLSEGSATFTVVAFDRSFWSSSTTINFELTIDSSAPKIEVLSKRHSLSEGGAGFILYRASDQTLALSGVMSGDVVYPGFKASLLDSDFEGQEDIFFSLFAVPLQFDSSEDILSLFARDRLGNTGRASFRFTMNSKKGRNRQIDLTRDELARLSNELYSAYKSLGGKPSKEVEKTTEISSMLTRAQLTLAEGPKIVAKVSEQLFSRPQLGKLWQGAFYFPGGAAGFPRFSDTISYAFEGERLGDFRSPGVLFSSSSENPVRGAASGKVIFVDGLGLLGKTIVLDHGFGLTSVYSGLSSSDVLEGDIVMPGQVIGQSGNSSILDSGCLFQTRIFGIPVRPEEWWDEKWINTRIDATLSSVKRDMGLSSNSRAVDSVFPK